MKNTSIHILLKNKSIHPSWLETLESGLIKMNPDYLEHLLSTPDWLPGIGNLFNAFSLPKQDVTTILLGESPYPRAQSANGYAFWDGAVGDIWSEKGLSTAVNRATSLRNFIKMLLVADQALNPNDVSPVAIAALDKTPYLKTLTALFQHLLSRGFLLLNASLVLSEQPVAKEAAYWYPFLRHVLTAVCQSNHSTTLLLFGQIAGKITPIIQELACYPLICEHPYNISFINNTQVLNFFRPLKLLKKFA